MKRFFLTILVILLVVASVFLGMFAGVVWHEPIGAELTRMLSPETAAELIDKLQPAETVQLVEVPEASAEEV